MAVELTGHEQRRIDLAAGERRHWRRRLVGCAVALTALIALGAWWNSRRPENCYRRARRALFAGDRATVDRESQRLLRTRGFEPRGHLLAGLLYARSGKAPEALQELQLAAQDEAIAVEAMTAGAECYYNMGRLLEAVELSQRAIERDENALDAHRWLAAALYDLGAMFMAAAELKVASLMAPADPLPDRLLGLINKDTERFSEAVGHYRQSLSRGLPLPARDLVARELAQALIRQNSFDEAVEALRECDPCAQSLELKAECRQSQGRLDDAEELLRDAVRLDPEYMPAKLELGSLLLRQRRAADAVGVLEDAVRLAPHSSQAHYQLAQALDRTGADEKSAAQLRLMEQAQADERRFAELHEAAALDPRNADVRYRLGLLARRRGQPELARMWFRAVLAIQPDRADARSALE